MVRVIDRVRAAVTGDDPERFEGRREVKRQLAEAETKQGRAGALSAQQRGLKLREAAAVEAHQKTCEPIQKELSEIETEITAAILAGDDVSDKLAKRRADALEKVALANSKLEAEVGTLKKLRREIEKQRAGLQHHIQQITTLRGRLTSAPLANPQMLDQRFVLTEAIKWSDKRRHAAEREVATLADRLETHNKRRGESGWKNSYGDVIRDERIERELDEAGEAIERELRQWRAELEAAEAAHRDATEAREKLREKMLAE